VGLQPTVFYRRQKEFFENGAAAFEQKRPTNHSAEQERIGDSAADVYDAGLKHCGGESDQRLAGAGAGRAVTIFAAFRRAAVATS